MQDDWQEIERIALKAIAIADELISRTKIRQAFLDGRYYELTS